MADLFTDAQLAAALKLPTVDAGQAGVARQRATDYLRTELGVEFANGSITLSRRVPRGLVYQQLSGPLTSITSVTVDGAALTVTTDYEQTRFGVACPNGFGQYLTTEGDWCTLVVVYAAGFSTIPSELTTWGLVLAAQAYAGPLPGVKSSSISVDGVSEAATYDAAGAGVGLPDQVMRGLRAKYGSGRRLAGSVLVR